MVDYYAILSRALNTSEARERAWRQNLYDHARHTLAGEMRARRPQPSQAEVAREYTALEEAVRRIETERALAQTPDDPAAPAQPDRLPLLASLRARPLFLLSFALVVSALCAGTYVFWASHQAANLAAQPPANKPSSKAVLATKDADIPPGIDGGPMDADQSYVFRRQPTFYRTLQPVGTVIIDKLQHFLYLVQPNGVALRYGIGIGAECADLAGPRRVASMVEWPSWEAPRDMARQKLAQSGTFPGGPGNPLGARVLALDDNRSRIHGTNAPKTIGTNLNFGCFRLVNDDIVDLYDRVRVGTLVLVN